MAEEFVSFEIAKKLKEKGYKWKCYAYYIPCARILICNQNQWRGGIFEDYLYSHNSLGKDVVGNDLIDAPTISQVLKWMREEKNIHIAVDIMKAYPAGNLIYWGYNIVLVDKYEVYHHDWNSDSYEEAAIAGIEYVLDNLI